jgi:hypothetical protein
MKVDYDTIELLKSIKDCVFKSSSQKYGHHARHEALRKFVNMHQDKNNNSQEYYQRYKNQVEVAEHCGVDVGIHAGAIKETLPAMGLTTETATPDQLSVAKEVSREEYLACAFILGVDRKRYGKLVEDTKNAFIQKDDKYPKTLVKAYKQDPKNLMQVLGSTSDGVAFTNLGDDAKPKKDCSHITCYNCGKKGPYSSDCTEERQESGTVSFHLSGIEADDYLDDQLMGFKFFQQRKSIQEVNQRTDVMTGIMHHQQGTQISRNWILLDNQSTVNVFCNGGMLENIRMIDKTMNISCNAGVTRTSWVGDLPGYGQVWYHKKGIANILSLSKVEEKYRITYDSEKKKQFVVHKGGGEKRYFKQAKNGLFYLDASEATGTVLVTTVEDKKSSYMNRSYKQAILARKLQNIIGRPSARDYLHIVENNLLKDCPIVGTDVVAAEDIFGPNVGFLKGKTVRRGGTHVNPEYLQVPSPLMEKYHQVTLCIDIMFVNKLPFLVTISRDIKFGTVKAIKSRKHKVLLAAIKSVRQIYVVKVTHEHMDGEF